MSDRLIPAQIRGARGLLNWSMLDLARAAGVSISTVKRIELVDPQPVSHDIHTTVQAALETAGVCFLPDDGNGVGLRCRRR